MNVSQALKHGMVEKSLLHTEAESDAVPVEAIDDRDSLFVSEDEGEVETQRHETKVLPNSVGEGAPSTTSSLFSRPATDGNGDNATNPFLKQLGSTVSITKSSSLSATVPPFIPQNAQGFATKVCTFFLRNYARHLFSSPFISCPLPQDGSVFCETVD